jgi:ferric-dicitrate binding protein FerR (iron transport regulator)
MLFQGSTVEVRAGSLAVSTSKGIAVQVGILSIKPAKAERTRFEVRQEAGVLQIVAREGSLAVSNGKDMVLVEPGQVLSQAADATAPSLPRVTSAVAPALIIGLLIAAGVAAGVGVAVGGDEVSPSAP